MSNQSVPVNEKIKSLKGEELKGVIEVFGSEDAFKEWQCSSLLEEIRQRLHAKARSEIQTKLISDFSTISDGLDVETW